jgi:hypothetical protein
MECQLLQQQASGLANIHLWWKVMTFKDSATLWDDPG